MKFLRSVLTPAIILSLLISLQACHSKKKLVQANPPAETPTPPPPAAPVQTPPPPPPPAAPAPEKPAAPDYNFSNIQFEFNSGVLKTESYPVLDKTVAEMKKDPSAKFTLDGYASAEGTDAHNMKLSVDRANSVKAYLVNSGVGSDELTTKGHGEANPVADNSTEAGRVINRRVEIKVAK